MGCGASAQGRYEQKAAVEEPTAPGERPTAQAHKTAGDGEVVAPVLGRDREAFTQEENAEYEQTMQFLRKVPLLRKLPENEQPILAAAVEHANFAAGDVVIRQGDDGAEFYVIQEGQASVFVAGAGGAPPAQVAQLQVGDYFGEKALLRIEPRTATVVAETALSTLKITREKFHELGLNVKLHFANRKAVGAGTSRAVETRAPEPKTEEEHALIARALLTNGNLHSVMSLDEAQVESLVGVAWREAVPKGQRVITEGDIVADYFYIVQEGRFEVRMEQHDESQSGEMFPSTSSRVNTVRPGGSFGELALLYLVPRAATVVALEPSVVWVIDRGSFKQILMKASDAKLSEYTQLLDAVEVLTPLLQEEKKSIAQALVEMHFSQDEVILKQGDPGSTFYILYEGEVAVIKDGVEQVRLAADSQKGVPQLFGERALLTNEPRAATVAVTSEAAKVLALDRDSFNLLLGPLQDIINASQAGVVRSGTGQAASGRFAEPMHGRLNGSKVRVDRKDLRKVGLLGCGGFGTVELCEHRVTGETYALKGLSKGFIVRMGMQESVLNEKHILMMTSSPFIIKLHATYNGTQMLYFLLEAAMGGELYATYSRRGLHGSERHARYYVAGVTLAFEHCHERRIIYRDLKPENLLFTEQGHIKLTDMGLAKFVIGKTFTTCGTPDYFAPELIRSGGHTNALDWWTLGILLFELLTGHAPFEAAVPMLTYTKVLKGISKVIFPSTCYGHAQALVRALLESEPAARLPMRPGGAANLKGCSWYASVAFDWEAMSELRLAPPYVPAVRSKTDIANFFARREDMPPLVKYKDDGSGWDRDFALSP